MPNRCYYVDKMLHTRSRTQLIANLAERDQGIAQIGVAAVGLHLLVQKEGDTNMARKQLTVPISLEVTIECSGTGEFDQDQIRQILAEYLTHNHRIRAYRELLDGGPFMVTKVEVK
jgi:hypothetical protein